MVHKFLEMLSSTIIWESRKTTGSQANQDWSDSEFSSCIFDGVIFRNRTKMTYLAPSLNLVLLILNSHCKEGARYVIFIRFWNVTFSQFKNIWTSLIFTWVVLKMKFTVFQVLLYIYSIFQKLMCQIFRIHQTVLLVTP